MDICNRDSSNQESKKPSSNKARSKKRPGSQESEENGLEPKRRRGQLPKSREKQNGLSNSNTTKPSSNGIGHVSNTGYNTESDDDASPPTLPQKEDRRPSRKRHHNLVEQKYRQRLNSQFKRLLDVLPPSSTGGDRDLRQPLLPLPLTPPPGGREVSNSSRVQLPLPPLTLALHDTVGVKMAAAPGNANDTSSGSGSASEQGGGTERRVSKGEVLDRALLYIKALERKHRRLVAEKRELEVLWEENYGCKGKGVGRKTTN
ncbi:hypothetical protein C8A03DRAFT_17549 [Achaetomium macrosporum]|uniref:BHLH domain-containing protein n=1 Tax=Achaetomium macrosporum TaxID=79813 RepID=A0AAN7C5F0_9PEZI|nr:hypothetical protein C8A03DRAFT_17549 [Achaetomium macrosporum]